MLKSHKYLPLARPYVNKKALKQQQTNVIHEKMPCKLTTSILLISLAFECTINMLVSNLSSHGVMYSDKNVIAQRNGTKWEKFFPDSIRVILHFMNL